MLMAKESLMEPIDMAELKARGPKNKTEELRIELYDKVNALGIGAQGLGGLSTVLDVKIRTYPTHAANQPVAMIPNCAATRHTHFVLDGSGPAEFEAPSLSDWPAVTWTPAANSRRVNLDTLTRDQVASWKPGDRLLLNGKLLTGRDAARSCRWTSPTASSTTSARWIRCAMKSSARRVRPPRLAWTSSPT
jgi:fumarate hydratase class I